MSVGTPVGVASRQQGRQAAPAAPPGRLGALWTGVVAGIAAVVGLIPHVLHHVGFLAGTALVAGAGGTVLFGAVGLAASVPFLLRLHRRCGTWQAPAAAFGVFAVMFAASALLIGPAINGTGGTGPAPAPAVDHNSHHQ